MRGLWRGLELWSSSLRVLSEFLPSKCDSEISGKSILRERVDSGGLGGS